MNIVIILLVILTILLGCILYYSIQQEDVVIKLLSAIAFVLFLIYAGTTPTNNIEGKYTTPIIGVIKNESDDEYVIIDSKRVRIEYRIINTNVWLKDDEITFIH